jgi:hypothetical protein
MELVGAHRSLELGALYDLANESISIEQHFVAEQHIINADDSVAVQLDVIQKRRPGIEFHVQAIMQIVV